MATWVMIGLATHAAVVHTNNRWLFWDSNGRDKSGQEQERSSLAARQMQGRYLAPYWALPFGTVSPVHTGSACIGRTHQGIITALKHLSPFNTVNKRYLQHAKHDPCLRKKQCSWGTCAGTRKDVQHCCVDSPVSTGAAHNCSLQMGGLP